MGKIGYLWRRLSTMDTGAMFQTVGRIHKKTGKSRIWIVKDMLRCAKQYGSGYVDYELYEMYELTEAQKDTFLTRGRNNALIRKYNDPEKRYIFDDKDVFNKVFDAFMGRDWLVLKEHRGTERLDKFLKENTVFIAKPIGGTCGRGVEKIKHTDFDSFDTLREYVLHLGDDYILEQLIVQHPLVSAIYPDAVNTIRLVTLRKDGVTHVIYAVFRIGNGSHVDNFSAGGMVAPVDEKTGIVIQPALDKKRNLYTHHPATGAQIQGFRFPDWQAAMDMAKEASLLVEGVNYIGWDIAFSENGPVFVEGNPFPGHNLNQMHTPDHVGIMEKFNV